MTLTDTRQASVTPEFLGALEDAYAELRRHHPDLPRVLILAETPHPAVKTRLAHFSPEECVTAAGAYDGRIVFMYPSLRRRCPCVFDGGAEKTFSTLAHEATHALAFVRGVKDTSRDGNYHNARFFELAVELGLEPVLDAKGERSDRGTVAPTPATREVYAATIEAIAEHIPDRFAAFDDNVRDAVRRAAVVLLKRPVGPEREQHGSSNGPPATG